MAALTINADGLLPVGVHAATLADVETAFVKGAPFEPERQLIFDALKVYASQVWQRFPDAKLWIDGGFITLKAWAAPKDVDIAVVVPDPGDYDPDGTVDDWPLWTRMRVSVEGSSVGAIRMQPMGGLVDGFFVAGNKPGSLRYWQALWQRLRLPDQPDQPDAKGFVEVVQSS